MFLKRALSISKYIPSHQAYVLAKEIFLVEHLFTYLLPSTTAYTTLLEERRSMEREIWSTAVEQVVACALITQRARVRSPVGTSFLGEVFSGFSSPVRQMSGSFRPPRFPNIIWPSLSSILIHYRHQWPELLTCPNPANKRTREIWEDFYCTGAMIDRNCTGTNQELIHVVTRLAVHDFHHKVYSNEQFHNPYNGHVCKICGNKLLQIPHNDV